MSLRIKKVNMYGGPPPKIPGKARSAERIVKERLLYSVTRFYLTAFSLEDCVALCYNLPVLGGPGRHCHPINIRIH